MACLPCNAASAASSYSGAKRTSTNRSASASPSPADTGRFSAQTIPKAETGSEARARSYASSIVAATATPHGFACLMITQAGSANSRRSSRAAERSSRLISESSFPWSCSTRESR